MAINGIKQFSLPLLPALSIHSLILTFFFTQPTHSTPINNLTTCIKSEREALLAIKSDLNTTFLSSWTGPNCCTWTGITCDPASGHVTTLDLRNPDPITPNPSNLNPSLSLLAHLKHLDLSLNNFNGAPIPNPITSLHHLEYLNLSYALFNGTINQLSSLSTLQFLDLHAAPGGIFAFHADDLAWLSGMPRLRYLDLSGIDLSAAEDWILDINMLPALSVLKLQSAQLGAIPATLPHLNFSSLMALDLSSNYFNSTIPRWFFNLTKLVDIRLSASGLHDDMQSALGDLISLQHLDLSMNYLSGSIPENWGNLSQLEYLDLTTNQIEGEIPVSFGNLSRLQFLDLSMNQIGGPIPITLGNIQNLEHLSLWSNSISGSIPESIGNLRRLSNLLLQLNQISGSIPETIGKLEQLQSLHVSFNEISGEIPASVGNLSLLQEAVMSNNNIGGEIPETMGKLQNLNHLELQKNNLGGSIPSTMGDLCKLEHLELSQNNIEGSISALVEGFARCIATKVAQTGLIRLLVGRNRLNGTVPEALGQVSSLVSLDLSSNSLMGAMTEVHFAKLANLSGLDLSFNSLEMRVGENWLPPFNATGIRLCGCKMGPGFPAWFRTQKGLSDICLADAGISGRIPDWLWDSIFFYQTSFNVSHNNLTGQLPSSVGGFMFDIFDVSYNSLEGPVPLLSTYILSYVHLSNNLFSGPIPQSFAPAVINLQVFSSSHNLINGSIPSFFCNLTGLRVLDLSNNALTGGIPHCWDNSSWLGIIDFSNNNLFGQIPSSLGSLIHLQSLHLSKNGLRGGVPSSLGNCNKLITLDLAGNYLNGGIPAWIGERLSLLRILILRENSFDGDIPVQLSQLTSLQILDLSHNNLSGSLPPSLGKLSAMLGRPGNGTSLDKYSFYFYVTGYNDYYFRETLLITKGANGYEYSSIVLSLLTSMDLSSNALSGEIPEEITNLSGLLFLNLSNNHFSAKIPQRISALVQLESLDLSTNNLSGNIPPSLGALSFLSHLNLSYNNLSGRIPSGTQLQGFDQSVFKGNPDLCGPPLSRECPSSTLLPESHSVVQEDEEDTESEMLWVFIGFAPGFALAFWGLMAALLLKREIRTVYIQRIDTVCDWIYRKVC